MPNFVEKLHKDILKLKHLCFSPFKVLQGRVVITTLNTTNLFYIFFKMCFSKIRMNLNHILQMMISNSYRTVYYNTLGQGSVLQNWAGPGFNVGWDVVLQFATQK